jgi:SAM-dependent methyltransferase
MNHTSTALAQKQSLPRRLKKSLSRRGWLGTLGLGCWKVGNYFAEWLLPSRYRARRLDREFDARFGVETSGVIPLNDLQIESGNRAHGNGYEQSKPLVFYQLLSRTRARYEDFVFVDLGSGKGRALLLASELPFKRIVGVEFAAELHQAAQENIRKYHSPTQQCRDFELLHLDAAGYSIPNENTIFYIYNSFMDEVMERVLANIQRSLAEHPREVFIIYCNAVHRELVSRCGFKTVETTRWHAIYRSEQ